MTPSLARFATSIRIGLCSTTAALLFIVPNGAAAQAADAPSAHAGTGNGNEIVVTATKREQTLQDAPVAVTVTTALAIEREHISDLLDLGTTSPSLRVAERQSSGQVNFFIRGFGNGANNPGIEPSVGVFVDGVYRSRSAAQVVDLPEVERIEVLRGPQSILFGKNASAGVVSITTEKPRFDFGGNVEASYGNYNALVLKGVVTGPLSDSVAVSLAAGYDRRDGYIHDLGTGGRNDDRNRWFVRGQLLFQPDSALSVRIIGDYGKIDETCCAVVNVRQSAATNAVRAVGGNVNAPQDRFANVAYSNFAPVNRIKNYGASGQVDYDLGAVKLTSITAYRRSDGYNNYDADFSSADIVGTNVYDTRIRTFTQEFRATAKLGERINLLAGAYYFHENIDQGSLINWGSAARPYIDMLVRGATGNALNVVALEGALGAAAGNPGLYTGRFFTAGQGLTEAYTLKNRATSLFGELDYEVARGLTLTGGLNYTHDTKRFTAKVTSSDIFSRLVLPASLASLRSLQFFPPFLGVPNAVEPGKTNDDNLSWTGRLSYRASNTINLYASVATGFKASSVNLSRDSRPTIADRPAILAAGLAQVNQSYGGRFAAPEKATVYEAGLKANWGVVTANAAVFKESIRDFQSNIFTGTGYFLGNAGKESVFGIEFEGTVRPVRELTLGLAWTYLDPKYDSYPNSAFGDATGIMPANIAPLITTLSAQYDHALGNDDHVILFANFHYEAPTQTVEGLPGFIVKDPATGLPANYQPGLDAARPFKREVEELNGSLTYAMHNGLELSLWARNLLDDRYVTVIFDSVAQSGSISAYVNQPRTYGATARFRW